jgi:hypothetical protein
MCYPREKRITHPGLGRKTEKKKRLGKPRRRWNGNIKIDLKETGVKEMV